MELKLIETDKIKPNPLQPREHFDREQLKELAESIKTNELINPITVKQVGKDKYVIVAGERRWKAHDILKKPILCIVREYESDTKESIHSLIENIHRADLTGAEKGKSVERLMDKEGWTGRQAASHLGVGHQTINNWLALAGASPVIKKALKEGKISDSDATLIQQVKQQQQQQIITELDEEWEKEIETEKLPKREFIVQKVLEKKVQEKKKSKIQIIEMKKFERALAKQFYNISKAMNNTEQLMKLYQKKQLFNSFSSEFWKEDWNVFYRYIIEFEGYMGQINIKYEGDKYEKE